ncbi:MAG: hypothetical protein JWO56_2155 [Acidobacteria bacterium]|nr:hypothetical protein [Acidobacteriota bacterium]
MKMKYLLTIILAVLLTCGAAFADAGEGAKLTVRTFQFKNKDANKAAAAIKSLMSPDGSLSIQPSSNSLVVTDRAENLKQIVAALGQFDAPSKPIKLIIRLVSAGRDGNGRVPAELQDIAPKLAMLRFNSLETIGDADVEGREGEPALIDMGGVYRADWKFGDYDAASDSIKVNDLHLSKLGGDRKDQLTSLFKTSLNLKVGQTVILGASKVPESQHALMIVLVAKR